MKEYHKINTMYKRDPDTNMLIEGDWSRPEFEFLKDNKWVWTEKIHGTNIRVVRSIAANSDSYLWFAGKTDKAQIPVPLEKELHHIFDPKIPLIKEMFPYPEEGDAIDGTLREESTVCFYGEGYGEKVNSGGGYNAPSGHSFILFDIRIGRWWLKREAVEDIASRLGLEIVPIIGSGTLDEGIQLAKWGFSSEVAGKRSNPFLRAEGLVLKPFVDLHSRSGNRIITKIKYVDFQPKKKRERK